MRELIFLFALTLSAISCSNNSGEITTDSGLKYTVLKHGDGPAVEDGKEIHTHCVLTLENGKEVWSSRKDNEEFTFIKGKISLIAGFKEALSIMKEGDRFKVTVPPNLGYGMNGYGPDIPPNSTLIFDIEILKVTDPSDL